MKSLFISLFILLLGIGLGYLIQQDPGYILIAYHHWTIESSLWVGAAAILLGYTVLYIIFRLFVNTSKMAEKLHEWSRFRKLKQANNKTREGLCALTEGDFLKAEKCLTKANKYIPHPLINFLGAARAAQGLGHIEQRDSYLRSALKADKAAEIAVGLTQAELQIQQGQWEQALATLKHMQRLKKHHPYVLKLLIQVYTALSAWPELIDLLPSIKKSKLFSLEAGLIFERDTYRHALAATAPHLEQLKALWQQLPFKREPEFILIYIAACADHQDTDGCDKLIEDHLKKSWSPELATWYGKLPFKLPKIQRAETWLKKCPDSPELLFTLSQLLFANKLLGQAREYLLKSIHLAPSAEKHKLLARIYEALGDSDAALTAYQAM